MVSLHAKSRLQEFFLGSITHYCTWVLLALFLMVDPMHAAWLSLSLPHALFW